MYIPSRGSALDRRPQVLSSRVTIKRVAEEIPLADLRLVHGMLRLGGQVGVE